MVVVECQVREVRRGRVEIFSFRVATLEVGVEKPQSQYECLLLDFDKC